MPGIGPSLGGGYQPSPRRACALRASALPLSLPIPRAQGDPVVANPIGTLVVVPDVNLIAANFLCPLLGPVATLVALGTSSSSA